MSVHVIRLGSLLLGFALLSGCGSHDEKKDEASVSSLGALSAVKDMADQAEAAQKNGPVAVVDFRSLKELLPAEAGGLPRKEATGEKNGAAGFTLSTATAKYASDDNSRTLELTVVDGGGTPMLMGMAAWSMIDVDKETADGYEKTSQLGDYKSYEKYSNTDKSGEIAVLVNKRYLVTAEGRGVSMDDLKTTLNAINLDKLAAMK